MPRSLLARSLEPLVAVSWGVFLVWSVWMTAVWALGIDREWLGLPIVDQAGWAGDAAALVIDGPPPPHAGLRKAVLVLAENAELAWLALALIQVHLHVIATNGVNTARTWIGIAAGGAFLLAAANRAFGIPFGWIHFGRVLGAQLFGVPLGWMLLWTVLLLAARESVLRVSQRASHLAAVSAGAMLALVTMLNLHRVATELRWWWFWHPQNVLHSAPTPWWFWISVGIAAWVLLFLMREKTVAGGAAPRSIKPLIVLGLLNFAALTARLLR